jgi:hypothetical protein
MSSRLLITRAFVLVLSVVLILAITEQDAYAYTDPGSGALIWQLTVSALVGAGFWARKFLWAVFKRSSNQAENKDRKDV